MPPASVWVDAGIETNTVKPQTHWPFILGQQRNRSVWQIVYVCSGGWSESESYFCPYSLRKDAFFLLQTDTSDNNKIAHCCWPCAGLSNVVANLGHAAHVSFDPLGWYIILTLEPFGKFDWQTKMHNETTRPYWSDYHPSGQSIQMVKINKKNFWYLSTCSFKHALFTIHEHYISVIFPGIIFPFYFE